MKLITTEAIEAQGHSRPMARTARSCFFKTSLAATGRASIWSASIISDGAGLRLGVPQKLFDTRAVTMLVQGNLWTYAASPDGQRFLVNALTETDAPTVNVITNWQQSVR